MSNDGSLSSPRPDRAGSGPVPGSQVIGGILVALQGFPKGLPDGEHRITTPDGKAYYGEVCGGQPDGRGLVMLPDGARYEGSLAQGRAAGAGMYVQPGGGAYYGNWIRGRLHGEVVHAFPGYEYRGLKALSVCVYNHGRLEREEVLEVGEHKVRLSRRERKKAKDLYRAPQPGEPVYRGHRSYDLVQQLQLGMTYSIAQSGPQGEGKEYIKGLMEQDGMEIRKQSIPGTGSVPGFLWKEYLPTTFQKLREMFGIDNGDLLLSMTGDETLRVVPSPGKSGSIFVISGDDRFMAKTVRKDEMRIILHLMAQYYEHCVRNRSTLLVRFYGIYRVSPLLGRRVRFLLMQNALPTHLRLHRRYDLKGSRYGRTAGASRETKPFVTLKDLDFILPAAAHAAVIQQIASDCALLEELNVMDYSLLLGVHFVRWGNEEWSPPFGDWGSQPLEPEAPARGASRGSTSAEESPFAAAAAAAGTARADEAPSARPAAGAGRSSDSAANNLAGLLRTLTRHEDELDAIVRSAASMVTHVGRSSVAAWNSAVRLSTESAATPRVSDGRRAPAAPRARRGLVPDQRVLSRQLSQVEERTQGLRGAAAGRSTHLLPRLHSTAGMPPPAEDADWAAGADWVRRHSSIATLPEGMRQAESGFDVDAPTPCLESSGGPGASSPHRNGAAAPDAIGALAPPVTLSIGTAMPALAIQTQGAGAADAVPQPVLLYFTIIDFLQEYNVRKRVEHAIKSQFHPSWDISVLNAKDYSTRFQQMIGELFVQGPSCSTPSPAASGAPDDL